jgi:hypothetical protein
MRLRIDGRIDGSDERERMGGFLSSCLATPVAAAPRARLLCDPALNPKQGGFLSCLVAIEQH